MTDTFVVRVAINGWKGYASCLFDGQPARIACQPLEADFVGRFSLEEATKVVAHFNNGEYSGWLAEIMSLQEAEKEAGSWVNNSS